MSTTDLFGKKGHDKFTGFEGTVTGVAHYLTSCTQYLLEAAVKDNTTATKWVDEARLVVEDDAVEASEQPGGLQPNAPQR